MYGVTTIIVTAIVLPLLGLVAVCLRFYVRLRLKPTFVGIDDWLIAFSCLLVFGQAAAQISSAVIGELGRDGEQTVAWRIKNEGRLDYSVLVIEKFTYSCIKLSVLFFYRRIFYHRPTFRILNNILIVAIILWGLTFMFLEAFTCGADSHHGHPCGPQEWLVLWFAITDVLGDMTVLGLPYPCIKALQMTRREKIGLSAVFMMGTLSLIFGIVRMGFVAKTFTGMPSPPLSVIKSIADNATCQAPTNSRFNLVYFHPSESPTSHNRSAPNFWTMAEVSIGLLAACLPPLGPLIRRIPSPLGLYTSIRHGLSSPQYPSGSSRPAERSSSAEHIVNADMSKGQHGRAGTERGHETQDQGRKIHMTQYSGFREMV